MSRLDYSQFIFSRKWLSKIAKFAKNGPKKPYDHAGLEPNLIKRWSANATIRLSNWNFSSHFWLLWKPRSFFYEDIEPVEKCFQAYVGSSLDTTTDWSTIPAEELYQKKIVSVFKYYSDDEIDTALSITSPPPATTTTVLTATATAVSSGSRPSKVRTSPNQVRRQVSTIFLVWI